MRVALLAQASSIHTQKWANALSESGVDVHVISQDSFLPGYHPNVVQHSLKYTGLLGYFFNSKQVRRILKNVQPDLLNSHYASGYGTLGRLSSFHPHLISVWGDDIYQFPMSGPLQKMLLRMNLNDCDLIASTSNHMAELTRTFTDTEVVVAPFGVDLDLFQKFKEKDRLSFRCIISKGLYPVYGLDTAIRAFADFSNRLQIMGSATLIELVIVGTGPLETTLKDLVSELSLLDSVRFLGHRPNQEIPELLNSSNVLINCSIYESFGVAAIEASACELPVIASNVGGLPEVIVDKNTGFLVEPGDTAAISSYLMELYLDPELCEQMGKMGRTLVEARYNKEKCVNILLDAYQKLLHKVG